MDNNLVSDITTLKDELLEIKSDYANQLQAFREKLNAMLITKMEQYGIDELILIPLTPNGFTIGSWDCTEEIDSEFECDQNDMIDCPLEVLTYGKSFRGSQCECTNVITRLGIKKGKLWFHTTEFENFESGDLSFSNLRQDNWQTPWTALSDYTDNDKVIVLLMLCLGESGNWEFSKNHPECCFLHRKLDSKYIRQRIADKSGENNLSGLFQVYYQLKKIDLAGLDASNATTVQAMFYHCVNLASIELASIDTSKCTSFESMFDGCRKLKSIDLSCLDTSHATTMKEMFRDCRSLQSLDLSTFCTRHCEDMSMMFMGCKNLCELNLSNWDLRNLDMYGSADMFEGCKKLSRIYLYNVYADTVEAIKEAVENASLKNVEIIAEIVEPANETEEVAQCDGEADENADLTIGKDLLSKMFTNLSTASTLDLNGLDTSEVVDGEKMFAKCRSLESINLQGLNFSKVRNLRETFRGCSSLKAVSLSGLDTSMVMDWWFMFKGCTALEKVDLHGIDTSRITNWRGMFKECTNLKELDLSGLDVSRATDMTFLFHYCSNLETLDLSGWDLYLFPLGSSTFDGCKNLKTIILRGCNEATIQHIKDTLSKDRWGEGPDISRMTFITE